MAIDILASAQDLAAGYNPVRFYIDSTNKNQLGFRYVVEIFQGATKIAEKKYPPRPVDGYAEVEIGEILTDFLSADIPFENNTNVNAVNSSFTYDVKFGEEYVVAWEFTDYGFNNNFAGGNTGLFQSPNTTAHPFVVGDQVRVQLDSTYTDNRESLNGLFTVVGVEDAYDFVISLNDVGAFPATTGKVYFADGRKTIFRDLEREEGYSVFNGALTTKGFIDWVAGDYALVSTSAKWLTNMPSGFRIKPDSDIWLNYWRFGQSNHVLKVVNSNGDAFQATLTGGTSTVVSQIYLWRSVTATSGALPVIKDDTTWVEFYVEKTDTGNRTVAKRLNIDRRCTIEDYDIVFMDRLGSFVPFSFGLRSEDDMNVSRKEYNKKFGDYDTGNFVVETYDSGHTPYHIEATETKLLRTGYMTDDESVYFKELVTSGWTYIKDGEDYYRCVLQVTSHKTIRQKNKRLIRYDVTVKYSLQTPINL